jgi:S1-C subfamily serine protease
VGIGFAIPSSMAQYVMNQLIQFGEVRRGTLGIFVQNLTTELAGAFAVDTGEGVLVAEVSEGSAAESAGLQPGDVIVRIANRAVNSAQDFHNAEGQLALGESIQVEFLREGDIRRIPLVIQSLPVLNGAELDYRLEGARFAGLTAKHKQQGLAGVLLDELDPRSRLAREGLAEGDIITGVNRQRVNNLGDFKAVLETKRSSILFQIRRRGRAYIARID